MKKIIFALSVACALPVLASVRPAKIFSDGMVLQQGVAVPVWGFAEPGEKVTVSFAGQEVVATADASGRWLVRLAPLTASFEGRTLTVFAQPNNRATVSDVLVGDVWILAGQSNMQYGLGGVDGWADAREKSARGELSSLRFFRPDQETRSRTPCADLKAGAWHATSDLEAFGKLSAAGFHFAEALLPAIGVPVGLVNIPRGGTQMFQWVDEATFASDGRFAACLKAKGKKKAPCEDWNGKVAPLAGLAVRGVVWYQGESDSWNPYPSSNFAPMLEKLVGCWRRAWGEPDLPFVVAQLPSMDARFWPRTREAQDAVARKLKGVFLANLIDTGWRHDVHPHDKQWVGPRLANAALKGVYGRADVAVAPRLRDATFDAGKALVTFDAPVTVKETYRRGFELKVGDTWRPAASAAVRPDGSVEVLAADAEACLEGVRYLYEGWAKPDVWLYGADGTPAFAFTTQPTDLDQELEPSPTTLFFAGDSTLDERGGDESEFASWGASLRPYLKPGMRIVNYAKKGRSTKSFRDEGRWGRVLSEVRPGDFVLIQFGHNDQRGSPKVAVTQDQFKSNLWLMVREVRARRATPFFATPIVRLTYADGRLVDKTNLDAWAQRMREVAREANVCLIDMRRLTHAAVESAGETTALTWYAPGDRTHPARKGARRYANLFLSDVTSRKLEIGKIFDECSGETKKPETVEDRPIRLQEAIDACALRGGGRVVVPAGRHLVGQIDLKSNVELHLEKGAVLEGKVGLEHYRVTTLPYSEGTWSAVVSAIGVTNVAVTGEGEVFGNGTAWPQPKDYGGNQEGRRPRGLFFADCKNVRLSDFALRDSACWGVVLKCCEDVDIRRIRIDSHANANNDGIDVEARNVVIADCGVDAGDDGVCLKSNNPDFIVENILVTNVVSRSHCNALKLGTASHGTMRNVLFVDCRTEAPRRDFVDRRFGRHRRWYEGDPERIRQAPGARLDEPSGISAICIENVDGGVVENVAYRNIIADGFRSPIFVRAGTRSGRSCGTPPSDKYVFRNIRIENVTGTALSGLASSISGVPGCRLVGMTLRNVRIKCRGLGETEAERTRPVPEAADKYPDAHMFGCMLPAYGLYVRHVDGFRMENVIFELEEGTSDSRDPIVLDDVPSVVALPKES